LARGSDPIRVTPWTKEKGERLSPFSLNGFKPERGLDLAPSVESRPEHPLGQAIGNTPKIDTGDQTTFEKRGKTGVW